MKSIVVRAGTLRPHTTMNLAEGIRLEAGTMEGVRTHIAGSLTNVGGRFEAKNNSDFVLTGDFVQGPLGTLAFERSDRATVVPLLVNGNVMLGGTLDLDYLRYTPTLGDQFALVHVAKGFTITGEFDAFPNRAINDDLNWRLDYGSSSVSITAVPEPGGVALLAGLALGLTATRRCRKNARWRVG